MTKLRIFDKDELLNYPYVLLIANNLFILNTL
jgi:hypothetical protein